MHSVQRIGRRAWFARAASGLVTVWAGLGSAGRNSWSILIGSPLAGGAAQPAAPQILDVSTNPTLPNLGTINIRAFVVVRGREAAVVDALLPGNAATIQEVLRNAGLGYDAVRHVILTHWHPDHAGSAQDISAAASGAAFYAGAPDIPMLLQGVPDAGVPPLRRDVRAVNDGEEVFGLRVVATPGHTAGHISLLEPTSSTLFTGDAVLNFGGAMMTSPPAFTANLVQAGESARKLARMSFERLLFAHGPAVTSGGAAALAQLLERFPLASDGQSLAHQSFETQSSFTAIHGAQAGAAWVREHEAALRRGHVETELNPLACCPFEVASSA